MRLKFTVELEADELDLDLTDAEKREIADLIAHHLEDSRSSLQVFRQMKMGGVSYGPNVTTFWENGYSVDAEIIN
jgi:hypothetical protein